MPDDAGPAQAPPHDRSSRGRRFGERRAGRHRHARTMVWNDEPETDPMRGDRADELLLRGYRPLRRVAPPDAPWIGTIVRVDDDVTGLLVDDALLGPRWAGWTAPDSDHVLRPVDVVRRSDGHDALLPLCVERLEAVLRRRDREGWPLADGERVTVCVSVLRALRDLGDRAGQWRGDWWVTDAGCPTFVADAIAESTALETAAAALALAADRAGEGVGAAATALVELCRESGGERRLSRDVAEHEDRLFAAAPPLPLAMSSLAGRRARSFPSPAPDVDPPATTARRSLLGGLVSHVDADLAALTSDTLTALRRRLRGSAGRRGLVPLTAAVAVAVVAIGLWWPSGSPTVRTVPAETSPPQGAGSSAPAAETAPLPGPSGTGPASAASVEQTDPSAAATILLSRWGGCGEDASCLVGVAEDPDGLGPATGAAAAPDRRVVLLDDLGGVAVLRIDADTAASQMAVLIDVNGEWLLRDVYDAAQQP